MMLNKIIAFCGIILCCVSCSDKSIYKESVTFVDSKWNNQNVATFNVDVDDDKSAYDIFINIENTDEYYYSNLYLFTEIDFPTGLKIRDTMNFVLANPDGSWIEDGKNTFPYKTNVRFPQKGKYKFRLEQAMRCDDNILKNISSVGINIIKR